MAQILVRNLDEKVVEGLKRRAQSQGRSLQAEVRAILEREAWFDPQAVQAVLSKIRKSFKGRRFSDSARIIRSSRPR